MLILAFLSLTLFPHHYHLHHAADPVTQDVSLQNHVIDIHAHADISDSSHHDAAHIIKPATDLSLKKPGLQLPWVVILMTLLLTMPLLALQGRLNPLSIKHWSPSSNLYTNPPLRAPPRT